MFCDFIIFVKKKYDSDTILMFFEKFVQYEFVLYKVLAQS